ncbi:hypothetical protein HRR86_007884 [Exophiala dermatitidis]|nr:hypothetical protein HRR79_005325 [Exophiala dermatitidis]KAJ4615880.1 hypothetical protein HRR86_007884 [Exophiala dermatitidis]
MWRQLLPLATRAAPLPGFCSGRRFTGSDAAQVTINLFKLYNKYINIAIWRPVSVLLHWLQDSTPPLSASPFAQTQTETSDTPLAFTIIYPSIVCALDSARVRNALDSPFCGLRLRMSLKEPALSVLRAMTEPKSYPSR